MADNDISVRKYKTKDKEALITVFNEVFIEENPNHIIMTSDDWDLKYKNSPHGIDTLVAENSNGQIVGQMSIIIEKIKYHDQEYFVKSLADLCVKKEFRNQQFIAKCCVELLKSEYLIWGFPAEEFWDVYPKIIPGMQNFNVKIFYKKINSNNQPDADIEIIKTDDAQSDIDNLWDEKKSEITIGTIRDWTYIKWAIIDAPQNNNLFLIKKNATTIGYFATREENGICFIIDILILNQELNGQVIQAIENQCLKLNCKEIQLFVTDPYLQKILTDNNFDFFKKEELTQQAFFACKDPKNSNNKISDFYLTWAQTDWYLYDEINLMNL
jgi:hypothetical protein